MGLIWESESADPMASESFEASERSPLAIGFRATAGMPWLRSVRVSREVKYVLPTPVSVPVIKSPFTRESPWPEPLEGGHHFLQLFRCRGIGGHENQDVADRPGQESEFPGRLADPSSTSFGGREGRAGCAVCHDLYGQNGSFLADVTNMRVFPKPLGQIAKLLSQKVPSGLFGRILQKPETCPGHGTPQGVGGVAVAVKEGVLSWPVKGPENLFGGQRSGQGQVPQKDLGHSHHIRGDTFPVGGEESRSGQKR